MSSKEKIIREWFESINLPMAERCTILTNTFVSNSRFGYPLDRFDSLADAERYTLEYYSARMHLFA